MKPCRSCQREVSEDAVFCPGCGAAAIIGVGKVIKETAEISVVP